LAGISFREHDGGPPVTVVEVVGANVVEVVTRGAAVVGVELGRTVVTVAGRTVVVAGAVAALGALRAETAVTVVEGAGCTPTGIEGATAVVVDVPTVAIDGWEAKPCSHSPSPTSEPTRMSRTSSFFMPSLYRARPQCV